MIIKRLVYTYKYLHIAYFTVTLQFWCLLSNTRIPSIGALAACLLKVTTIYKLFCIFCILINFYIFFSCKDNNIFILWTLMDWLVKYFNTWKLFYFNFYSSKSLQILNSIKQMSLNIKINTRIQRDLLKMFILKYDGTL